MEHIIENKSREKHWPWWAKALIVLTLAAVVSRFCGRWCGKKGAGSKDETGDA